MSGRPIRLRHIAVLCAAVLSIAAAPATGDGDATDDTIEETTAVSTEETTTEETSTEETSTEEASTEETSTATEAQTSETETAAAEEGESTEPEPRASATAVEVEDVIIISQATASENAASATVLELGGERIVGGDAEGGSNSGAIFDTGTTELGRLALGPWAATTDEGGSSSEASVAKVTVIDEDTFYAHVLRSRAAADGNGGTAASSDAVVFGLGGEDEVRVLSSTWTREGGPESALVRQGDETIGQDTEGQCSLEIPSIVQLLCLTGVDGQGGTLVPGPTEGGEYASVAEVIVLGEQELAALRAGGELGSESTAPATEQDTAQSPSPGDDAAQDPSPGQDDGDLAAAPDVDASSLPVTGGGLTVLVMAVVALAIGLVLRRRAAVTT